LLLNRNVYDAMAISGVRRVSCASAAGAAQAIAPQRRFRASAAASDFL
jgi:hypothetical protein